MRVFQSIIIIVVLSAAPLVLGQNSMMTTQIYFGIIDQATPVELKQNNTGKGAAAGTAVGALRDSNNRERSVVAGAAIGAAVGKMSSKQAPGVEYVIRTGPNNFTTLVSNQTELRVGDCVSVQQSKDKTTISRVGNERCAQLAPQ